MVYALADSSPEIHREHVVSALAVWDYAEESARRIFGSALGDADADKVLAALKAFLNRRTLSGSRALRPIPTPRCAPVDVS
jgi:hypothetical protein